MSKPDYYELLGISRKADPAEIKKAYKRMAMKHHPDRTKGDKAEEEKFKAVTQAYEVLSDPQKRSAYDQYGHAGVDPSMGGGHAGFADMGDMFGDVFADIFGAATGRGRGGQARGADLRYSLELSLEDAVKGASVTIQVPTWVGCKPCDGSGAKKGSKPVTCTQCKGQGQIRMQQGFFSLQQTCPVCRGAGKTIGDPCSSCHGQGRVREEKKLQVKIPPGVDEGDRVRLAGEGEAAAQGGASGDLYVEIHLREHPIFQREGENLYCEIPIALTLAALGGDTEVPTLSGKVKLHIPSETQTGKVFKLGGKGVKSARGGRQGDLLCRVVVETPVNLSRRQKELLEEFAREAQEQNNPRSNKWLVRMKDFLDHLKS